ncbi:hypothetical protein [Mycolicibacterium peregrinum]|uniref:Lipoprotein n=1 Tax=Mycolicibacterium peregrinum TaxID=43304 RepID=A0A1A0WF16_MYCPR|nr:hypothetical protein [Mycolicibacterium peregrinum]OBB97170.1 hypothetical protein A5779_15555 [Mycolicibacterium peregrinum]
MGNAALFTAAVLGSAITLVACSATTEDKGSDAPGKPADSATYEVPTATGSSDEIPADFPKKIPVVKGSYTKGLSTGVSRNLSVTGIEASAYDEAENLLTTAGFPAVPDPTRTGEKCDRTSEFGSITQNDYSITLCGNDTASGYELTYKVFLGASATP